MFQVLSDNILSCVKKRCQILIYAAGHFFLDFIFTLLSLLSPHILIAFRFFFYSSHAKPLQKSQNYNQNSEFQCNPNKLLTKKVYLLFKLTIKLFFITCDFKNICIW